MSEVSFVEVNREWTAETTTGPFPHETALQVVLHDIALDGDETGRPFSRKLAALRTSGLLGLVVPKEYGGLGGDGQAVNPGWWPRCWC
jgi:hypothetical protein